MRTVDDTALRPVAPSGRIRSSSGFLGAGRPLQLQLVHAPGRPACDHQLALQVQQP